MGIKKHRTPNVLLKQKKILLSKIKVLNFNHIKHNLHQTLEKRGLIWAQSEYNRFFLKLEPNLKKPYLQNTKLNKPFLQEEKKKVIKESHLESAVGPNGSFSKEQIEILGLSFPLEQNWKKKIIGKKLSIIDFHRFLELKPKRNKDAIVKLKINKEIKVKKTINEKSISNAALKIYQFLNRYNIIFEIEKYFDDCINPKTKQKLPFDFYIPNNNMCIEYDGEQHFKYVPKFHGVKIEEGKSKLQEQKYRDSIKTNFCLNSSIKLLRISYLQKNNIDNILNEILIKELPVDSGIIENE